MSQDCWMNVDIIVSELTCVKSSDEREELNAVSSPVHIYICVGGAYANKQAVMSLKLISCSH